MCGASNMHSLIMANRWLSLAWRIGQGPCRLQTARPSHQVLPRLRPELQGCAFTGSNADSAQAAISHSSTAGTPGTSPWSYGASSAVRTQFKIFELPQLDFMMQICHPEPCNAVSRCRLLPCSGRPAVPVGQDRAAALQAWPCTAQCLSGVQRLGGA